MQAGSAGLRGGASGRPLHSLMFFSLFDHQCQGRISTKLALELGFARQKMGRLMGFAASCGGKSGQPTELICKTAPGIDRVAPLFYLTPALPSAVGCVSATAAERQTNSRSAESSSEPLLSSIESPRCERGTVSCQELSRAAVHEASGERDAHRFW